MSDDKTGSNGPETADLSAPHVKYYEVLGGPLNAIPYSRLSILLGPDPEKNSAPADTKPVGRLSKRSRRRSKKWAK